MVYANHGGNVVTHCIHGVVALVAVERPVAFFVREELNLAHLAHGHVGCHFIETGALGRGTAVRARYQKLVSVQMHRVVGHGEITDANPHLVIEPDVQGIDARKDAAVPGPQIEVQHFRDLGRRGAGLDVVGAQEETEVPVHFVDQRMFGLGMRDPKTHHAHGHLGHFVGMGVVHECPRTARNELVDEGFAGLDRWLIQARHAVHAIRQTLPVPVDTGVLGQFVGHKNADAVAFHHLDGGTWALAVVSPQVGLETGRHFAHHGFCHQVELFDPLVHAPRQRPAVERDHGVVGAPRIGHQRRHGVCTRLEHWLWQSGHRHPAHTRCGHSPPSNASKSEKISS